MSEAVLVAIAIPIFSSQLEKSRESVDAANIRAAYAEVMSEVLTGNTSKTISVDQKQTKSGWQTTIDWPKGMAASDITAPVDGASASYWTVQWDSTNEKIVATHSAAASGSGTGGSTGGTGGGE